MKLNENYSIESDGTGSNLVFKAPRVREKNDGTKEDYIFEDRWFFLTVPQCLRKFLSLSLEDCTDVKDCLKRIDEVESKINKFPNQLSQK